MKTKLSPLADNPLVTLIVLIYNQKEFVEESILAALKQDYSNIQILISDDCSTDNSFEIAQKVVDKNRANFPQIDISLNKNPKNLGIVVHINQAIEQAKGDIIIFNAADDLSYPNRAAVIVDALSNNSVLVASDAKLIDENGGEKGNLYLKNPVSPPTTQTMIERGNALLPGCVMGFRREVYDNFGPISDSVENEDDQIGFRASLLGNIEILPDVLLKYRVHSTSLSSWLWKTSSAEDFHNRYIKNITNRLNHYLLWLSLLQQASENDNDEIQVKLAQRLVAKTELELMLFSCRFNHRLKKIFEINKKLGIKYLIAVINPKIFTMQLRYRAKLVITIKKFLRYK